MAYRDETDALRARVAELERKLGESEAHVERLLGRHADAQKPSAPDSIVGEVVHRVSETRLPVSIDDAGLDAMKRLVETRLGHLVYRDGRNLRGTRVRRAALAQRNADAFGMATNEHGTWLRLETDLRVLPVLVALGPMVGALLSFPAVFWQMDRLHHFDPAGSWWVSLPAVAAAMLLATGIGRAIAKRVARRAREAHDGTWAALLELVEQHVQVKARVAAIEDEPAHEAVEQAEPRAAKAGR